MRIYRRDNENLEFLLKRWKRQVNDDNILGECKKHEFFLSKADRRREKHKKAAAKRARSF